MNTDERGAETQDDSGPGTAPLTPSGDQGAVATDRGRILERYKAVRVASKALHSRLLEMLSKAIMERAARDLGMWHRKTIVLESESEMDILADHAIYDCLTDGRNAVDRYAAEHTLAVGGEEEAALNASLRAYYSVFHVREIEPGAGVVVEDLFRREEHFLADIALSETAVKGLVLATRVLPMDGFIMTAGASLPVGPDAGEEILAALDEAGLWPETVRDLGREEAAKMAGKIVAICLRERAAENVGYEEVGESEGEYEGDVTEPIHAGPRVGRNDPCPCGSGKKFKKCCGQ